MKQIAKMSVLALLGVATFSCGQAFGQVADNQAQKLGPAQARSFNFVTRRYDSAPSHNPFEFHILDTVRANNDDSYDGVSIFRTILSGSENYLAPKDRTLDCGSRRIDCDRFQNARVLQLDLRTHSPVQIGGALDSSITSFSPGDSIAMTVTNRYTGFDRGTDEASRLLRVQVTPQLRRWGGRLESVSGTTATVASPRGNVGVTVARCAGCDLDASGEGGAPIINLTRSSPLGNVTRTQVYAADHRFVEVTLDKDFGGKVSHWTTLTHAVDTDLSSSACGAAVHRVAWAETDPFVADEAGLGNKTSLTCFAVGSTEGLAAGTVVVVGGDQPNLETTRVVERVDATHFLANARMPHAGPTPRGISPAKLGEVVTWGGYAGYAAGFMADIVAPRGMSEEERTRRGWAAPVCDFDDCNDVPLYLTPFVMGSLPGNRLVLYIDAEAASVTLNTFGLMANEPVAYAQYTARVQGGRVVSLTKVRGGDYRQPSPEDPALRVNSGQTLLPPPRMQIAGCRVQPLIRTSLVSGEGLSVAAMLDTDARGEGCPDGDAVKVDVESRYKNPLTVSPAALVYRAIKPGEQREQLLGDKGYQLWMPPTGEFQVGDDVIATTWQLQQVGDVTLYARNLGFNSARFGPVNSWYFRGQGNEQPMLEIMNQTPPYRFYSDRAHGLAPTADGGGFTSAPSGITFTGAFSSIFNVLAEPRRNVWGDPGAFVAFRCPAGLQVRSMCEAGVLNPFRLFTVARELGGPKTMGEQSFTIDPVLRRWTLALGGAGSVVQTDAAVEATGTISGSAIEVRSEGKIAAGIDRTGGLVVASCRGCTLAGKTEGVGGRPLAAGACVRTSTHVAGAIVGTPVVVSASDGSLPGGATRLNAAVSAPDTVTVELCAAMGTTPPVEVYQVRVVP